MSTTPRTNAAKVQGADTINTPLKPDASVRAAIDAAMEGEK
jgi:hypothetical protein